VQGYRFAESSFFRLEFVSPHSATVFFAPLGTAPSAFYVLKRFESLCGLFIVAHRFLAWLPKIPETHPLHAGSPGTYVDSVRALAGGSLGGCLSAYLQRLQR
jgi:hypothetical protein